MTARWSGQAELSSLAFSRSNSAGRSTSPSNPVLDIYQVLRSIGFSAGSALSATVLVDSISPGQALPTAAGYSSTPALVGIGILAAPPSPSPWHSRRAKQARQSTRSPSRKRNPACRWTSGTNSTRASPLGSGHGRGSETLGTRPYT